MSSYIIFFKLFNILTDKEKFYSLLITFLILVMLFEMLTVGSFLPLVGSIIDENYISNFLKNYGFSDINIVS